MLHQIPIEQVLFLDIETVPAHENWEDVTPQGQKLWDKKTKFQRQAEQSPEEYFHERAGVLAEFGKIICISVGIVDKQGKLKIKSFADDDEHRLLEEFGQIFNSKALHNSLLCAHNGKEFDFPWIARRMLILGMMPPKHFRMFGKKPWEIPHLDTMEMWKFGDWKNYTSLELLAHVFGVPTPKDDIDGSQVAHVYYVEKDLPRIVTYCEKDVLTLANVFRRMRQEDLLERSDD